MSNNNTALFSAQPAVAANGTLTYTPAAGATGTATVTVRVRDTGGTTEGHGAIDTSDAQTFTITVSPAPVAATSIKFKRTDVWMSTSSANRKFDLKAEVLKNGVVVATKVLTRSGARVRHDIRQGDLQDHRCVRRDGRQLHGIGYAQRQSLGEGLELVAGRGERERGDSPLVQRSNAAREHQPSPRETRHNGREVLHDHAVQASAGRHRFRARHSLCAAVVYKTAYTELGTWSITGP